MEKETAKKEQKELSPFEKLLTLNVNDKTDKKNNGSTMLTYLSWSFAWGEFKKVYPEATYEIKEFPDANGRLVPYLEEEEFGLMVWTKITAGGQTYQMWLPVMDSANRAMKRKTYTVTNKFGKESTVAAVTMWEINKTIMRCLVKNMAMFGLGLYIYSGEDLPEDLTSEPKAQTPATTKPAPVAKKAAPAPKPAAENEQKENLSNEELLERKNHEARVFYARQKWIALNNLKDGELTEDSELYRTTTDIITKLDPEKDKQVIDNLNQIMLKKKAN